MDKNTTIRKACGFFFMLLLIAALSAYSKASAADTVSVVKIDYSRSVMSVRLSAEDTVLMISDAKKKKWETVLDEPVGGIVEIDISWISQTKDYVLSLKGDVSSTPVSITIPKQNKDFKVTYSPSSGLSFSGRGNAPLQWKKKNGSTWKNFPDNMSDFNKVLAGMISKGGILVFRTAPVNGTGDSTGMRASKEVSVTIRPKAAAPVMSVDNSKMTISLKKGMEYRYCDENGQVPDGEKWNSVDKDTEEPLSDIAAKAMSQGTKDGEDVYIQFRTIATDKNQISNISTIMIPGQKVMPSTVTDGISIDYVSTSACALAVKAATDKAPYEYCIITKKDEDEGVTIDSIKQIVWNTISNSKSIPLTKSSMEDGSTIYVRKKAVGTLGAENYELASQVYELPEIKYPKELSTLNSELTWLQTIAGTCRKENSGAYLVFNTYSTVNTPVTEIKFVKYSGLDNVATIPASQGRFTSTVRALSDSEKAILTEEQQDYAYLITTTIISTEDLEEDLSNADNRKLLLYFKQGESSTEYITSTEEKGVALYIHPKSFISNPDEGDATNAMNQFKVNKITGDHGEYLSNFTRIYNSNFLYLRNVDNWSKCDPNVFSIAIKLGTIYEPKTNTEGELTGKAVEITKITYDGIDFKKGENDGYGNPFFVQNVMDETGVPGKEDKRTLILTIDTWAMEKNALVKPKGTRVPVNIYLSNGEVLSGVTIEYVNTAYVVSGKGSSEYSAQSWSLTGLQKTEITTTTTINGVTTTVTSEHDVDKVIWLKLYNPCSEVVLEKVQFDGHSICKNIETEDGYIKAEISNTLLNKVIEGITTKTSKNLYFVFDNGAVLTEGYKIIINTE